MFWEPVDWFNKGILSIDLDKNTEFSFVSISFSKCLMSVHFRDASQQALGNVGTTLRKHLVINYILRKINWNCFIKHPTKFLSLLTRSTVHFFFFTNNDNLNEKSGTFGREFGSDSLVDISPTSECMGPLRSEVSSEGRVTELIRLSENVVFIESSWTIGLLIMYECVLGLQTERQCFFPLVSEVGSQVVVW